MMIRKEIGVDNLMWSSDYPHTDTTWPNSRQYIEDNFEGVPAEDKYKIVAGNAKKSTTSPDREFILPIRAGRSREP